jgi:hypothetical protein
MMICALLLGIICAVARVGAVLRFDGDADAEIEDVVVYDRPRVLPRRRQTKSGQPVGPRTDEPSIKRHGLCFSLAKGADVVPAERLLSVGGRTARGRCAASMNEPNDDVVLCDGDTSYRRSILVHIRQLIQKESGRCGDFEVHTSVCVPVAFAAAASSSAAHRPTCFVFAVLSSSKRPPQPTTRWQRAAYLPWYWPRQAFSYTDPPTKCLIFLGVLCVDLRVGAARRYGPAADRRPVRRAPSDLECLACAVTPASPTDWKEASASPLTARAEAAVEARRRTRQTTVSSAAPPVRLTA